MIKPASLGTLVLLTLLVSEGGAKEWRGIVPLKSTRTDVERLLGKPNALGRYEIGNERVSVSYSEGPCEVSYIGLSKPTCECLVTKDTVLKIAVVLELPERVSKFAIDKQKYERTAIHAYQPTATYADFSEGIVYTIRESDDTVTGIDYLPSSKDCTGIIQTRTDVAHGWKGIVPMHSTRGDVEQLLGPPKSSVSDIYIYATPGDRVDVSYSADPCKGSGSSIISSQSVVVKIMVSPETTLLVQSLNLDKQKYKRIQLQHPETFVQYVNSGDGITVEAVQQSGCEQVRSIIYHTTARHRELRCGRRN